MPAVVSTLGDLAADFAADYGLAPDPWQRLVLDDWLACADDDRWAALTCGLSMPRQNGKNALLEIRELFGMVGRGEKFLHTAHEVKTARKAFKRLQHFFGASTNDPAAKFPELNRLVKNVRNVNGQEAIELHNGGSVEVVARSKNSARGFTVDVLIFDEAQEMGDEDLEALMPTTSAAPQGNPQWLFTGTPPGPNATGEVFARTREAALDGEPRRTAWHEWSCKPDADPDDEAIWRACNPALGIRLDLDVVRGERDRFSDGGFLRERLGLWPAADTHRRVIGAADWDNLVAAGPADGAQPDALGVDMSHDRAVAIAGCWTVGSAKHVEVVALDYVNGADTLKAVDWLVENAGRRIPVVIDAASPAASLIPVLKARRVKVIQTGAGDMVKACGLFYDDVVLGRLTHLGQHQLDAALAGARKRPIRDAGGWGWDRRDPSVNLAPLVAVTLARFGAANTRANRPKGANGRTISNRRAVLV